jgi:hypothetical protein
MTDKYNLDFEDLVAMQEREMTEWRKKLMPQYHHPVTSYVREHNVEAATPQDKHVVFRGQDLIEIIRTWPEPEKSGYPSRKKAGSDFI